jgi:hypothetical protein
MLFSYIFYAGLGLGVIAARRRPLLALTALSASLAALLWPARTKRVAEPRTKLDGFMPSWQFDEVHMAHVAAPPERVYAAVRAVTAKEIRYFKILASIRRLGCSGPESILRPDENAPILDVATRTTFHLVADEPPREIVIAIRLAPETEAAMNFLVESDGTGGSFVTTETRVFAATEKAARRFATYWRVILPGSDIIRRMWLRAVRLRATN